METSTRNVNLLGLKCVC